MILDNVRDVATPSIQPGMLLALHVPACHPAPEPAITLTNKPLYTCVWCPEPCQNYVTSQPTVMCRGLVQREISQLSTSGQQPDSAGSYPRSFSGPMSAGPSPPRGVPPGGALLGMLEEGGKAAWAGFLDCRKHPLGALEQVLEAILPPELFAWTSASDVR